MKTPRTTRSLLRRTLIASAALAAATAVATPEAHASEATTSASTAVASYLGNKLLSALFSTGGSFLWESVFSGASSTLSATDLATIQGIIDDELTAHELADAKENADAVLKAASEYRRGTTAGDLTNKAQVKVNTILGSTNSLLQDLDDYGMNGSSTYLTMAALRISFLKEQYEIDYALRNIDPITYEYTDSYLSALRDDVANQAMTVLTQLQSFEDTFDAQFGAVTKYADVGYPYWYTNIDGCVDANNIKHNGLEGSAEYCFSGPDGMTCGSSFDVYKCQFGVNGATDWTAYSGSDALDSIGEAQILLQQAKMSYRDSQLAPEYYELRRNITRIADGDFEYCGNGVCGIGEIDSCDADCAGQFDEIGHFSHTTWGDGTLLSTSEARLDWQSDGNLVLYDTTTSPASIRWQADLVGATGYKLVFQSSNGDLVIRNSSNTVIWESGTSDLDSSSRLVLLGKTLYIMDGDGTYETDGTLHGTGAVAWSSDDDPNRYQELESRFCYDTSANKTLLSSNTGYVKWTTGGNLRAYTTSTSGSTLTWSTGTSGAYLCNQEDGNLVIYSAWGQELWSSGTYRGVGGHLVMVGDQLRTTTDSGDLLWVSPTCSGIACTQDNRVASLGTSTFTTLTKSQARTLLENDKARLEWQNTGNLALYNKATGAKIYQSGTAGTGAKLVYGPSGLVVQDSSNLVKWTLAPAGQAGSIALADCNLFAADYSTGEALGATHTSCDDTAN
jgi:hypothetical protein